MVLVVLYVVYSVQIKYRQTKFNQVHDKSTGRCPSQNVRCEAVHVRCRFDVQNNILLVCRHVVVLQVFHDITV